ncbi:hypothetical protein [Streptomyces coeruleofuscus]|uniref:hypothetical protein n=1 Tax=Streptomyces coeruleofuscus TaxID=66879 RepID=UPI0031F895B4
MVRPQGIDHSASTGRPSPKSSTAGMALDGHPSNTLGTQSLALTLAAYELLVRRTRVTRSLFGMRG